MAELRRGVDRSCTRTDWLTSWHSFSYGQWYDASNVGFGPLVVSNHDVLAPGAGFDDHEHAGVDLVTYVVAGRLEHRDSTGHVATLQAGGLQVLHAGSGVVHSERNASATDPVEYVQMWLTSTGTEASYEQTERVELATGSLAVAELVPGERWSSAPNAHVYLVSGELSLGLTRLSGGDALRLRQAPVELVAQTHSRLLAWSLRIG